MKRIHEVFLLAAALAVLGSGVARAGVLQTFDHVFQGDDPTEGFVFTLDYDPSMPSELRFDGFAENLSLAETGVRFFVRWGVPEMEGGGSFAFPPEPEFAGIRLPGTDPVSGATQVALHFGVPISYTPGGVMFVVEGLGPTDHFRLVGDLTVQPVPEPGSWAVLLLGGVLLASGRRLRLPVCSR